MLLFDEETINQYRLLFDGETLHRHCLLFDGDTLHQHLRLPDLICTTLRKSFDGIFLLMLGIHARNVCWDVANCTRVDATSESSD